MNAYGARAMEYMRQHRPAALAEIRQPEPYFTALGEEILAQVLEAEEALAAPAPPTETFMERLGRLKMARLMAEELVLAELVYSTWEDEEEPPIAEGWEPLIPPNLLDDEE